MKKITYILISLLVFSTGVFAQTEIDALRFSREDIFGTARAMSMGGAFGALGGDQTGVSINPAGIAIYRSSEVVGTLGLMGERSKVGNETKNRTTFDMDNIGFVGYYPLRSDVMPFINFGFTYNRAKSFNKNISAFGELENSLLDFIVDGTFGRDPNQLRITEGGRDPFITQPWLSVLAYNTGLINQNNDGSWSPIDTNDEMPLNRIRMRERGYINNYSFTMGTTINDVLSIGAALNIKDISYRLDSEYDEDFSNGGFTLENMLTTDGAGVGAKLGIIYRPVHQLRIGAAYHTPTWYTLTETARGEMFEDITDYEFGAKSAIFQNNYTLKTPEKWTFSLAGVLGGSFIASVDYELVGYQNMRLGVPAGSSDRKDFYDPDNKFISDEFKLASTVRLGMEYRFTPQFSGRLGYAWMQNPYGTELKDYADVAFARSNSIFRMEGDTNYFTGGFGYRFNRNFFLDFALVYKTQTDELYPFPNWWNEADEFFVTTPFELKNNSLRGMVTLGYRF
ncbi:MAG: outer membrane protein transport protein [Dysgonamonadaceae bacterium]|jgi:hypothetical protein|nr:outer membrane protein transport protein [Dysgonamonadaceae bacterium]